MSERQDGLTHPIEPRIRRQGLRVNHAALLAGHGQGAVLLGFAPRRAHLALCLRGVVARRGLHGRLAVRLPRTTLQTGQFITQLLVLDAQGGVFRRERLDEVQQLHHDLARGQVGNGLQVDGGDLHTRVV